MFLPERKRSTVPVGVRSVSEVDFSEIPTTPWELESVICLIAGNGNPHEAAVLAASVWCFRP
jgi:hypothetical protein